MLPFGYGFALIEQTGAVLFHFDKTRNMRENFLQESDWNRELSAAAFGHSTQGSLHIRYLGKDYRARVVPIGGLSQAPWSLIVYRDLTSVRTLDLQSMTMASTLLLLFLAGPFLFIAVWCLIYRPRFAPECVWPNQARMATYVYQIALYAVLIVVFVFLGFRFSAEETVIASAAVPYTALLLTFWCFRLYPVPGRIARARERVAFPRGPFGIGRPGLPGGARRAVALLETSHAVVRRGGNRGSSTAPQAPLYIVRTFKRRYPANRERRSRSCAAPDAPSRLQDRLRSQHPAAAAVDRGLDADGPVPRQPERGAAIADQAGPTASGIGSGAAPAAIDDQHEKGDRDDSAWREFFRDTAEWHKMGYPLTVPSAKDGFIPLYASDGNPSIQDHSTVPGTEIYSDWFRRLIYSLHHDYNDAAAETLGVIADRADADPSPDWTWQDQGSAITLVWHGAHPRPTRRDGDPAKENPPKEHDLVIRSAVPAFSGDTWTAVGIAPASCSSSAASSGRWRRNCFFSTSPR